MIGKVSTLSLPFLFFYFLLEVKKNSYLDENIYWWELDPIGGIGANHKVKNNNCEQNNI